MDAKQLFKRAASFVESLPHTAEVAAKELRRQAPKILAVAQKLEKGVEIADYANEVVTALKEGRFSFTAENGEVKVRIIEKKPTVKGWRRP